MLTFCQNKSLSPSPLSQRNITSWTQTHTHSHTHTPTALCSCLAPSFLYSHILASASSWLDDRKSSKSENKTLEILLDALDFILWWCKVRSALDVSSGLKIFWKKRRSRHFKGIIHVGTLMNSVPVLVFRPCPCPYQWGLGPTLTLIKSIFWTSLPRYLHIIVHFLFYCHS